MAIPWKGPSKVAALLLTLEPPMAAKLLGQMDQKEIATIGGAMSDIDPELLDDATVGELQKEFVDSMLKDQGPGRPPNNVMLENMLNQALSPDQARKVYSQMDSMSMKQRPFLKIERLKIEEIKQLLDGEHPQLIAFVCARMDGDTTALLLDSLPEEQRNEVISRMANLEKPNPEFVKSLIASLETKADSMKGEGAPGEEEEEEEEEDLYSLDKKLKSVATILKTVDMETEKQILANLDEKDEELANQIREFMFTFEDLASIDKKNMQKILMGFDIRLLATALKSADPAVEKNFVENMSKRVQSMLAEERELLEDVTVEEVTEAQKEILKVVRQMIDQGEIQIPRRTPNRAK